MEEKMEESVGDQNCFPAFISPFFPPFLKKCEKSVGDALKHLQVADLGLLLTNTRTCRLIKNNWTEKEVITATGNASGTIAKHPLNLQSSYASVKVTEGSPRTRNSFGEPLVTSFHSKFLGTVDYLWYSGDLVPTRVLDTPPIDIIRKTHGLPHKKLGSDHLALVSEFAFML